MPSPPVPNPSRPPLRRSLGLFEVTMSGVGLILGAGIYVLIGPVSALSGTMLWLAFLLSAVIALFTGLSDAELSSMFPKAGAEYDYVRHAFSPPGLAFVIGWLIFLSGVLAAATVALGFAGYFFALTGVPMLLSASVLIILLAVILAFGVKETAWVAIISTIIELVGLLIVIWIGIPYLGTVNYFELPQGFSGLFAASALIFFAYQGFESMVKFSEETRDPETTIPKALLLSLSISVILYVLVALAVISVMGWQALAASKAPFVDLMSGTLGPGAATGIAIIALFATANTSLMSMYASSRILYGMSGTSPRAARARVGSPPDPYAVDRYPCLRPPVAGLYFCGGYRLHCGRHQLHALCDLYRHQRCRYRPQVQIARHAPAFPHPALPRKGTCYSDRWSRLLPAHAGKPGPCSTSSRCRADSWRCRHLRDFPPPFRCQVILLHPGPITFDTTRPTLPGPVKVRGLFKKGNNRSWRANPRIMSGSG